MTRKIFRNLTTPENAIQLIETHFDFSPKVTENIPLINTYRRILSESIISNIDVPGFTRSRMDGFAVRAQDTLGADEETPIELKVIDTIHTGAIPQQRLEKNTAIEIGTGAALPAGADSVIMVEYTHQPAKDLVQLFQTTVVGQNIVYAGSDIAAGEQILSKGTEIGPIEMGVLAAIGKQSIPVFRPPLVAIFATGNEIIPQGDSLTDGKVYNINSYSIYSGVIEAGGLPTLHGILPDNDSIIKKKLEKALQISDVIITSGSTSAGIDDNLYQIIDELGKPGVLVHGISVKPGKPTIIGVCNNTLIIGLPGYPTSAMTIFTQIVMPLIKRLSGRFTESPTNIQEGTLTFPIRTDKGRRTYQPVSIVQSGTEYLVYPSFTGSSAITTLSQSDGYITIHENTSSLPRGTKVPITMYSNFVRPANLAIIGSHSIANDLMLEILRSQNPKIRIKQINTGSLGGLHAVASGFAQIAGIHLLDSDTEKYNLPYVSKFQYQDRVAVIKGFTRPQGFIVRKGNPLQIHTVEDLLQEDLQLINRNPGSGTRILLDQLLLKQNIPLNQAMTQIKGYQIEVKTHSAVASAIKHGRADVGLGIQTIAQFNDLDFIKIRDEEYDFAIQRNFLSHEVFQLWQNVLTSQDFASQLQKSMSWITLPSNVGEIIE